MTDDERASLPVFWCVYDYGQGGVWKLIRAASREEITARFPDLKVLSGPPSSLAEDVVRSISTRAVVDLQDADEDPFLRYLRHRPAPRIGFRAHVRMSLDPKDSRGNSIHLPSGTRSLLYRFKSGGPDETTIGMTITTPRPERPLVAGETYEDVILDFFHDANFMTGIVNEGDEFIVWHGVDKGSGTVISVERLDP